MEIRRADWNGEQADLRAIRDAVFVREQAVPATLEHDGRDEGAEHFVARGDDGRAVGTARLLPSGQIGRVAVLREHRGRGLGRKLLDLAVATARACGHPEVFLHAQVGTEPFYAAAGFRAEGERFVEAGIDHVTMRRTLHVEFVPTGVRNLRIEREPEAPEPPGVEAGEPFPESGGHVVRLTDGAAVREAVAELFARTRRELLVFSQELDPTLFDNEHVEAHVSRLARGHRHNRLRFVLFDSRRAREGSHRVLQLRSRLPSRIQVRLAHPEFRDSDETFVVADRRAVLVLPRYTEHVGYHVHGDPVLARRRREAFDQQWNRAGADPDLRQLTV
jgi:predicted GNAT family N-acyltransferase